MKYRSRAAIWKQLRLWTLAQSQYKHNCGGFIRRNNSAALSEGNQTPLLLGSAADVLVGGTIQNLPGIMKHESDQGRLQAAGCRRCYFCHLYVWFWCVNLYWATTTWINIVGCFFSCVANEVTADKGDNSAICTGENGLWKRGCVRLMELNAQDLETTEHYFEVIGPSSGRKNHSTAEKD